MPEHARRRLLIVAAVGASAIAAGIGAHRFLRGESSPQDVAIAELQQLTLPDAAGAPQNFGQWKGKVLVLNFWATWCEPCREEIPALIRTQQKFGANGVQIVGIGIDSAAKIRDFSKEYKINYPLTVGGLDQIDLSRRLGNKIGGLPYTLVIDRAGRVVKTKLGGISEAELEALLRPLLV